MPGTDPLHVLFVCSMNKWRSPTAEQVWKKVPGVEVRSAGTSEHAPRRLGAADLHWADLILVMEDKHAARIRAAFRNELHGKPLHVLDIPDEYQYMDPELVELIRTATTDLILGARGDAGD